MTFRIKKTTSSPTGGFRTKNTTPGGNRLLFVSRALTPPTVPLSVSASAGSSSATVVWTSPLSNGGSPITGYTVLCIEDSTKSVTVGITNTATVTLLTPGTPYTFEVYATNAIGDSPNSPPTSPVTPYTTPSAPTSPSAIAGVQSAQVSWVPPADGGSPITSYTVLCLQDGTKTVTVGGGFTTATVTGLTAGTPYTFEVYATNAAGNGPNSSTTMPVTPTAPVGYTLTAGTKAPVLGATGQSPFPAAGWSALVSTTVDDSNVNVALPFTWTFNGTGYTSFYQGSNAYITFGAGANQYSALSATNPPNDKIHIASADNSYQRVSSITSGTDYVRLRYEGTAGTSGIPGAPNIVYEITFFNPTLTGGYPWVELLVGSQARGTSGATISGLYSSTALLTGGGMGPSNQGVAANQSYVLVGNSTGTSWTVNTGYHVGGTDY